MILVHKFVEVTTVFGRSKRISMAFYSWLSRPELNCSYKTKITLKISGQCMLLVRSGQVSLVRRGEFDCNAKEYHSNSWRNPQQAGHTNEQNCLLGGGGGLQKRDFPIIAGKCFFEKVEETVSKVKKVVSVLN
jgi:hypothetical protein